jgi:hypothetical protein
MSSLNAAYIAEMNAWIDRYKTADGGIPPEAAGTAPAGQDLLAMRDYGGADRAEGRDFESDPLLAVFGTHGHSQSHDDDLVGGMALQMVLLTATDARLATSMLSQPMEIPDAREDLRRSLHRQGTPQMIIRVVTDNLVALRHAGPSTPSSTCRPDACPPAARGRV